MSVSDSSLPLKMTEALIEGQEGQHVPLTGFALCGLEKWGFHRYAPTSPVPRREGPYNQSLSAPLTSAFAFLWACDLSRDLLPAVWRSGDFVATLRHPLSLAGRALTTKACQLR